MILSAVNVRNLYFRFEYVFSGHYLTRFDVYFVFSSETR